jgi:NAD(P)-dependent dehydrogenase (short-subunit alcohol dehydrogenase family)
MAKAALVTGSTDGIGRETARQLLSLRWTVLVHGRSEGKAARNAEELSRDTGGEAAPVWGDLSRMREVVALAGQVRSRTPVLDVLINNAGIYEKRRRLSEEGFEMTMAVNHFAPYLLTRLVGPAVSAARAGRVINVSSIAHQSGRLDVDDLGFTRGYDGYEAYAASKLANILFTRALGARVKHSAVTVNALHPGVIDTKLLHAGFDIRGAPVEEGARTSVYLATSDEVSGVSGKYFVDCREATPSRSARDDRLAERLWVASERLLAAFLCPEGGGSARTKPRPCAVESRALVLVAEIDAALGQIVRRHFQRHLIAGQDADSVLPDLSGSVGGNAGAIVQRDPKGRVRQHLVHNAIDFQELFFSHSMSPWELARAYRPVWQV